MNQEETVTWTHISKMRCADGMIDVEGQHEARRHPASTEEIQAYLKTCRREEEKL